MSLIELIGSLAMAAAAVAGGVFVFSGIPATRSTGERVIEVFEHPQHLAAAKIEAWRCSNGESESDLTGLYLSSEYGLGLTDDARNNIALEVRRGRGLGKIVYDSIEHPVIFQKGASSMSWAWDSDSFDVSVDGIGSFRSATFACEPRYIGRYTEQREKDALLQLHTKSN